MKHRRSAFSQETYCELSISKGRPAVFGNNYICKLAEWSKAVLPLLHNTFIAKRTGCERRARLGICARVRSIFVYGCVHNCVFVYNHAMATSAFRFDVEERQGSTLTSKILTAWISGYDQALFLKFNFGERSSKHEAYTSVWYIICIQCKSLC